MIYCPNFGGNYSLFFYKFWDTDSDLGNGYFYLPPYEALDIGSPYGAIIYKSDIKNTYTLGDVRVSATVVKAKSRGDYIIAIQELKNDTVKKYFIIDKRNDKVFKDLNKKEFLDICSNIGIKSF